MKNNFKSGLLGIFLVVACFASVTAQNDGDNVVAGRYRKLFSKVLNEERTLLVSLPEGYENSSQSYPVLYVLDGTVDSLVDAISTVRTLGSSEAPDMIIVAIANTKRNRDMIPGSDTAPRFLRFLTEELFAFVTKEYRTDDLRVIYGASNAGLAVMFAFLDNPDNFSGYIASSPTICHRREFMMQKIAALIPGNRVINKALYIIYGDKDFKEVPEALADFLPQLDKLKSRGLRLQTRYLPEAGHVPLGSLQSGLLAVFDGYAYPEDKWAGSGLAGLKTHYEQYSAKLGVAIRPPLPTINRMGQLLLLEKNQARDALPVFEYGDRLYPGNFACTVMLAVAHYRLGTLDGAKKYYFKAREIMKADKQASEPPFDEWREMKQKFEPNMTGTKK